MFNLFNENWVASVNYIANSVRNKRYVNRANIGHREQKYTRLSYFCKHAKYRQTMGLPLQIVKVCPTLGYPYPRATSCWKNWLFLLLFLLPRKCRSIRIIFTRIYTINYNNREAEPFLFKHQQEKHHEVKPEHVNLLCIANLVKDGIRMKAYYPGENPDNKVAMLNMMIWLDGDSFDVYEQF